MAHAIELKEEFNRKQYKSNSDLDSDVLIMNNDSTITNNDSTKFEIFYNDSYYDDLYKSKIIELDSNKNNTNWKNQKNNIEFNTNAGLYILKKINIPTKMNQEVHANEVFSIQCSDTKCITHYPFVYEFGLKSKFFKQTKKHRWNNCCVIYIVFQGNTQIGAAKHLDTPHYQLSVAEIIKIVKSNSNKLKCNLIIIDTEGYNNDEFMYIQSMNISIEKRSIQKTIIALTKFKKKLQHNEHKKYKTKRIC